jgi:D-glycero-alpha-D-manno-heptose 1-phosphate guanylyltransferase
MINAGVYVLSPELFAENLPHAFSFERDFLPTRLAALKPRAFMAEDYFIDIGIPEDYARAQTELPEVL